MDIKKHIDRGTAGGGLYAGMESADNSYEKQMAMEAYRELLALKGQMKELPEPWKTEGLPEKDDFVKRYVEEKVWEQK